VAGASMLLLGQCYHIRDHRTKAYVDTMPTDNANSPFIGREKILEQLRDSLQFKNGEHARAALWGLGGSG